MTEAPVVLPKQRRRSRWLRRFARHDSGATAVEFALVAVPFFALIFAVVEVSLIFFGSMMLEEQLATSARLVLTGEQQTNDNKPNSNGTPKTDAQKKAAFAKSVCNPTPAVNEPPSMLSYMFDCTKVKIDVRQVSDFSSSAMASPILNGAVDPSFGQYTPGNAKDIVVVRILYEWPTLVINWPYRAMNLVMDFSNITGNKRVLMAAVAFRNEPYE